MLTSPHLTLSEGNPLVADLTLTSPRGDPVTDLAGALEAYLATTLGGERITDPVTTITYTEESDSPVDARVYRGLLPADRMPDLLALGLPSLWLAVRLPDGLFLWAEVRCERWRRFG